MLVSIPEFQTLSALSMRLQIPKEIVLQSLEILAHHKMVKKEKDRWIFIGNSLHLSQDSPLTPVLHGNWRGRAVMNSQFRDQQSLHYTSLHSLSLRTYQDIKRQLLKAIDETHAIAGPSQSEELACVTLNFFRV